MTAVRFSIVIPTRGRASLYVTLSSIFRNGLEPCDEVIVVGDGSLPDAANICNAFVRRGERNLKYLELERQSGILGGPARNMGIAAAAGTHLLFIDDDDVYRAGAIVAMRLRAAQEPRKILIFKMAGVSKRHKWDELWTDKEIRPGNVGTPMFVVPRMLHPIPEWPSTRWGDYYFLREAVERFGGPTAVSWEDEIVADIY